MTAVAAINPERLEHLLEQVPVEVRAKLRWGGRAAMRALLSTPPSDGALTALANSYIEAVNAIVSHARATVLSARALEPNLPELFDDLASLRRAFEGTLASSAVEWATESLELFFRAALSGTELPRVAAPVQASLDGPAYGMIRAYILLLAISIALSSGRPADELLEYAEWAFLEAAQAARGLEHTPFACTPFVGQTPEERAARVLRYASELRASMDPNTVDAIEAARVRKLF